MAEEVTSGPAELGAPMDYPAHEGTYAGFVSLAKISIVATVNILLALMIYAYADSWGFAVGTLVLLLAMIAAAIGMASGSMRASLVVFVIGVLLAVLTVA